MRKTAVLSAIMGLWWGLNGAAAADLSYKDTPYEAPLAPIWTGFYVGGHVGGLWNDSGDSSISKMKCYASYHYKKSSDDRCYDWKKVEDVKFTDDDDDVTLLGGVHIGYNLQEGDKVFGIEADLSFADGVDYLASLRVRLGHAIDSLLIYATAGVAFVGFDDTVISSDFYGKSFDISGDNHVGVVVGGGAEYKLSSNWSVGVEGLYYLFGDDDNTQDLGSYWKNCYTYYNKKFDHDDDNDLFVVRARLSYHFQDTVYEAPLK